MIRRGGVLIVVAGIAALIAALTLAFLASARSQAEEMSLLVRETQARLMLSAACAYIQEASRIGWEDPLTASREHVEAFGWIDVRDGGLGPRPTTGGITAAMRAASPDRPVDIGGEGAARFPVGVPRRFPMQALRRPPFAIGQQANRNPVSRDAPDSGRSFLRYPDPQPAVDNGWIADPALPGGAVHAANFADWVAGDPRPRPDGAGAWFRLVREATGAVFTVTCGVGGSRGYRTWQEVVDDGATAVFMDSQETFAQLRADEVRAWYRVEWSAATASIDMNHLREFEEESLMLAGMTYTGGGPRHHYSGSYYAPNLGGTIAWIARLRDEPALW